MLCRSLNSNKFVGTIPPSVGKLSKLYWLDMADNQLTGTLPVSKGGTPGLDMLLDTKHLYVSSHPFHSIFITLFGFHLLDISITLQSLWKESTFWRHSISAFQPEYETDTFVSSIDPS